LDPEPVWKYFGEEKILLLLPLGFETPTLQPVTLSLNRLR
jgi:hypothetical protein